MKDYSPVLQAQIDYYADAGTTIHVPDGVYDILKPVRIRNNVTIRGTGPRGTVFRTKPGTPFFLSLPDALWVRGEQAPCDSNGLILAAGNTPMPYFAWDSVTRDWGTLDDSFALTLTLRWDSGGGYVFTYGGSLAPDEPPPWGASLIVLRVDTAGRLTLATRTATCVGPVLSPGQFVTVMCQVSAGGIPQLYVGGNTYGVSSGSATPLPQRQWWHNVFLGGKADRFPAAGTQEIINGRISLATLGHRYGTSSANFLAADGPLVPTSDGEWIPVRSGPDAAGQNSWGLYDVGIEALNSQALIVANSQKWRLENVEVIASRQAASFSKNCYQAAIEQFSCESSFGGLSFLNNGGMYPVRALRTGGGFYSLSANNCFGLNADGAWVDRVNAGGVAVHVHNPDCVGSVRNFMVFDEGNVKPLASVVATGGTLALRDSFYGRRSQGYHLITHDAKVIRDNTPFSIMGADGRWAEVPKPEAKWGVA